MNNNDTITLAEAAALEGVAFDTDNLTIASYISKVNKTAVVMFPWTPGRNPLPKLSASEMKVYGELQVIVTETEVGPSKNKFTKVVFA